ncbi:MAG: phosphoglycerate kinase [Alphaproteobacteria bacterium]|nr:phosphoglycerate kinase [Alphaproteobacteria bacterium]
MKTIRNLKNINVHSKYVLLREDFNVQIVDGIITDTFRLDASLNTIKRLVNAGARVVICSHLGRPNGKRVPELSLRIVAEYLNIPFVDDCLRKDFLSNMKNGEVVLMENLRFYIGEEKNEKSFAKKLADGFDIYVNDAFAVSHRKAASIVAITKYLPSYAGDLLENEIQNLTNFLQNPKHPLVAFVGGAKIDTKINVLKKLVGIADKIVIGGAMGTTFNFALGLPVGNSLYEPEQARNVMKILKLAYKNNCEILLPIDKGVGEVFDKNTKRINRDAGQIKDDDVIMDDGKRTTQRNIDLLYTAKTVVWNGTFGLAEWGKKWGYSSFEFAKHLAHLSKAKKLKVIVGGGDTVAALDACGVRKDIAYVSTGGGAFLEFIEGKTLPGIKPLIIG